MMKTVSVVSVAEAVEYMTIVSVADCSSLSARMISLIMFIICCMLAERINDRRHNVPCWAWNHSLLSTTRYPLISII